MPMVGDASCRGWGGFCDLWWAEFLAGEGCGGESEGTEHIRTPYSPVVIVATTNMWLGQDPHVAPPPPAPPY